MTNYADHYIDQGKIVYIKRTPALPVQWIMHFHWLRKHFNSFEVGCYTTKFPTVYLTSLAWVSLTRYGLQIPPAPSEVVSGENLSATKVILTPSSDSWILTAVDNSMTPAPITQTLVGMFIQWFSVSRYSTCVNAFHYAHIPSNINMHIHCTPLRYMHRLYYAEESSLRKISDSGSPASISWMTGYK